MLTSTEAIFIPNIEEKRCNCELTTGRNRTVRRVRLNSRVRLRASGGRRGSSFNLRATFHKRPTIHLGGKCVGCKRVTACSVTPPARGSNHVTGDPNGRVTALRWWLLVNSMKTAAVGHMTPRLPPCCRASQATDAFTQEVIHRFSGADRRTNVERRFSKGKICSH